MTVLPYQLTDIIGRGSHGRVYRALDTSHNRTLAIKITPKTYAASQEVEMIQQLQSCRHTVKYVEHYELTHDYAIVMEEVVGVDGNYMLDMSKHGIYPTEKEIRDVAKQLCEMVYDCHKMYILYGDVKPSNYIYTPPKTVTVIDFGCARKGVHFQVPLGTPLYFSPQKFDNSYGLKSDVWSIGVLLYELACGHHPYAHQCTTKDMLLQQILSTSLTFHHPQWDTITDTMQDLLQKMLEKDEKLRISAEEALNHPWWEVDL